MKKAILLLLILLSACQPPMVEKALHGLWLGNYQNEAFPYSLPVAIDFKEDHMADLFIAGDTCRRVKWEWINDELYLDTLNWVINEIGNTTLTVRNEKHALVFGKIEKAPKPKINLEQFSYSATTPKTTEQNFEIWENLMPKDSTLWIERVYQLGLEVLTVELERTCFLESTSDGFLFWHLSAKVDSCNAPFFNLRLLSQESDDALFIETFSKKKANKKKYLIKEPFDILADTFFVCNENRVLPHRYTSLKYKRGKPAIEQLFFEEDYEQYREKGKDGFLTLSFVVNCKGQVGRYSIKQTDLDFAPIVFNTAMLAKMFGSVMQLKEWVSNKDRDGKLVDTRTFLNFKIIDGIPVELIS